MAQESSLNRRRYPRVHLQVPIRMSTIDPGTRSVDGSPLLPNLRGDRRRSLARRCARAIARTARTRPASAPGIGAARRTQLRGNRAGRVGPPRARYEQRCRRRQLRTRTRVPRRHAGSCHAARNLPLPALVGRLTRSDGLIVAYGDGYAPAPMRPPGSYKIASRGRALEALLGPELRNERRAQRILDSLRSEILGGRRWGADPPYLHQPA